MSYRRFHVYFFVTVLVGSGILTLLVFRSYLVLLALGGVLGVMARPFFRYLRRLLKSDTAAAFLTVILVSLILILPVAYFLAALSTELIGLFSNVKGTFDVAVLERALKSILPLNLQPQIPAIVNELLGALRGVIGKFSADLIGLFSDLLGVAIGFVVLMLMLYYLLKDGSKIKSELLVLSPLSDEHDEMVFQRVAIAVRAVMNGMLVIGLLKGLIAGVTYWIFGVPAPLFWGVMTGLASFLPVFGTAFVSIPIVLYLYFTGHAAFAVGMAVIAVAVLGTIDNVLQPKLVESKTNIHPLLVLLSILGGLQFYGFAGFILGPLTLAVTMALLDIYKKEFKAYAEKAQF